MNKNDGGPAYPSALKGNTERMIRENAKEGMSLRDYFAGQSLSGIMAAGNVFINTKHEAETVAESFARQAYLQADAMLKERDK